MKKIIVLVLFFCSLHTSAQENLKIKIDNPEPRVGQSVTFSIEIDFLNDYFKKELDKTIELNGSATNYGLRTNDFEKTLVFKEAREYTIGPFNFEYNGKKYTTNTIEVNVEPELPIESGVWLRATEFEGKTYIILEQYIENESNLKETDDGGYSHHIGGILPKGKEFATLNENLTDGIKLSNYSSSSNTLTAKNADLFDVGFSYSIKKYRIEFDENFKGSYTITERDFENLPKKNDIEKIELKN